MHKRVTPDEFEKLLKGETIELSLEENEQLNVLKNDEWGENISISNLKVEGDVHLKNEYPYFIRLIGDTIIGNVFISEDANVETILISENASTGDFDITGKAKVRSIHVSDNVKAGYFHFKDKTSSGAFELEKNAQIKGFNLLNNASVSRIKLSGKAKVENGIVIKENASLNNGSIRITDEVKTGYIKITGSASIEKFRISLDAQTGPIEISGSVQVEEFSIVHNAVIASMIYILQQANINKLIIEGSAQIGKLIITGDENLIIKSLEVAGKTRFESIEIENLKSEDISFSGANISGSLQILNSECKEVEFRGDDYINAGKISFVSSFFRRLRFIDVQFSNPVELARLKLFKEGTNHSYIEFSRSSFSRLFLNNNDFEKLNFLVFESSDITNSIITQTKFPRRIQSSESDSDENKHLAKLFYEQLKTSYNRLGNRTESIYYQAQELNIHYSNLHWIRDFKDWFVLWFHKKTSFFGTDWLKGLYTFVKVSILLYTFTLWSTQNVTWTWPWLVSWSDFATYTSHFFEFINPTSNLLNKWNYIYELEGIDITKSKSSLSGWVVFWLYLSKSIMVVLYYQFIQAFRRLGK